MKNTSALTYIVFCLILFSFLKGQACQIQSPDPQLYFASYEQHKAQGYKANQFGEPEPVLVNGCNKKSNKFLMIGIAPERQGADFLTEMSFLGDLEDAHCSLQPNPFGKMKAFSEVKGDYFEQTRILNACLQWKISDSSGSPIEAPKNQPGCTLTRVSPSELIMSGGYCFLKPYIYNQIEIHGIPNPLCTQREELVKQNFSPRDIPAKINFYLTGDASGNSTDVEQLARVFTRFTLVAGTDLLPNTTDYGIDSPTWPAQWSVDTYMGPLEWKITGQDDSTFSIPYIVNNNCKRSCTAGLCSSPCHFSQPDTATVTLYELSNKGRKVFLDSWHQGGVIYPFSQGMMKGLERQMQGLTPKKNHSYEIEVAFGDPNEDYVLFQRRFSQILIDLRRTNLIAGRDSLPAFGGIGNLVPLAPYPVLPWVGANVNSDPLEFTLRTMGVLLNYSLWPPYYKEMCRDDLSVCRSVERKDNLLLKATFTVNDTSSGAADFSNLHISRRSPSGVFTEYESQDFPRLICNGI